MILKILLHCCCAPCAIRPLEELTKEGHQVATFFYNPNIHPYQEYKKRRNTFVDYMTGRTDYILEDDYALEDFLKHVAPDPASRCAYCYKFRLEKTAQLACEQGFDAFTSSLLISPYQNHDLLKETGEKMSALYGPSFYYQDFRPYFREGQQRAIEEGLYRQPYCGCIYSEKERYCRKKKKSS